MVFCRGCGKEIHESAPVCPNCGAPQMVAASRTVRLEKNMTFPDAVKTCFNKYFVFSGRAARSEYWFWKLFLFLCNFGFVVLIAAMMPSNDYPMMPESGAVDFLRVAWMLFNLGMLIPDLSVTIRRIHDINLSGWYWLISCIPLFGTIVMLVWACTKGTQGDNQYGADPLEIK